MGGNAVVCSITSMKVHFPPNGPLELRAGQASRAVSSLQSVRALPSPLSFLCAHLARPNRCEELDQKRKRRAAARRLQKTAYLHFLAVESQVMCAFSQADLLVGALSAAKAGAESDLIKSPDDLHADVSYWH
jgi:hypothetical protein